MAKIFGDGIDPHDIGMTIGIANDRIEEKREFEQQVLAFLQEYEAKQQEQAELQEEKQEEEESKAQLAKAFAELEQEVHMEHLQEDTELIDRVFTKYAKMFRMLDELDPEVIKQIEEIIAQ